MTYGPRPVGASRRRPVINGDPSLIAGPPWTAGLHYFVLLAAAAVDIVTFHQVLISAIDETELLLWVTVVGFTVVCLALSHAAGVHLKNGIGTRHEAGARLAAGLSLFGWVALGAAAFAFRWNYSSSATGGVVIVMEGQEVSGPSEAAVRDGHYSALLFLALYVATGIVAGVAAYWRHNPAVRQYLRALSKRTRAAAKHGRFDSKVKGATKLAETVRDAEDEHDADWDVVKLRCRDAADRLKTEIEFELLKKRELPRPHPMPELAPSEAEWEREVPEREERLPGQEERKEDDR